MRKIMASYNYQITSHSCIHYVVMHIMECMACLLFILNTYIMLNRISRVFSAQHKYIFINRDSKSTIRFGVLDITKTTLL